jgi:hypothetical protein
MCGGIPVGVAPVRWVQASLIPSGLEAGLDFSAKESLKKGALVPFGWSKS